MLHIQLGPSLLNSVTNKMRMMAKLQPIDFVRLKETVSIEQVLEIVTWKPVARLQGGTELRGPCPVHGSTSPKSRSFSVSTTKNAWRCFKCGAGGNALDLAAEFFSMPREESVKVAVELCKRLGLEIPRMT